MARPHPALVLLAAGSAPGLDAAHDETVLRSAFDHGMQGLLWSWVRAAAPDCPWRDELARADLAVRAWHGRLRTTLVECQARLGALDIRVATAKGITAEARWYTRTGERPCSDLDLLIEPDALDRASVALDAIHPGHPLRNEIDDLVRRGVMQSVNTTIDGVPVDLHFDLLKLGIPIRQPHVVWAHTIAFPLDGGTTVRVTDPELALVHHLVHATKDGFAWLLACADVARILRIDLDWDFVVRFTRDEGLEAIVTGALERMTRPLGLDVPAPARSLASTGLLARVFALTWPEHQTLLGSAGTHRSRRQDVVAFLVRGRFGAALHSLYAVLLPPDATVAARYPNLDGPYLWRITRGRLRTARERRAALAGRAGPSPMPSARSSDPLVTAWLVRRAIVASGHRIEAQGTSMGRTIRAGSRLRLDPGDRPRSGEIWAFCDRDGRLVVHRCRGEGTTGYRFQGDACVHADVPVDAERLVGRVVEVDGAPLGRRHGPLVGVLQRAPRMMVATVVRASRRWARR